MQHLKERKKEKERKKDRKKGEKERERKKEKQECRSETKNKKAIKLHTLPYIVASSLRLGLVIHSDMNIPKQKWETKIVS